MSRLPDRPQLLNVSAPLPQLSPSDRHFPVGPRRACCNMAKLEKHYDPHRAVYCNTRR